MYLNGHRYRTALLLDARRPRARADDLPGQERGAAGGIVRAFGSLSARRVGPGWLVVFGERPQEREQLLRRLDARVYPR